jgi:hypothetical protein
LRRVLFSRQKIEEGVRALYKNGIALHQIGKDVSLKSKVSEVLSIAIKQTISGRVFYNMAHKHYPNLADLAKATEVPLSWLQFQSIEKTLTKEVSSHVFLQIQAAGYDLDNPNFFSNIPNDPSQQDFLETFNRIVMANFGQVMTPQFFYREAVALFGSYANALQFVGITPQKVEKVPTEWTARQITAGIKALVEKGIAVEKLSNDTSEEVTKILFEATGRNTTGQNFYARIRAFFGSAKKAVATVAGPQKRWFRDTEATKNAVVLTLVTLHQRGYNIKNPAFFDIDTGKAQQLGYLNVITSVTKDIFGKPLLPRAFLSRLYNAFENYVAALNCAGLPTDQTYARPKLFSKVEHAQSVWALHRNGRRLSALKISKMRDETFRKLILAATGRTVLSGKSITNSVVRLYNGGWYEALRTYSLDFTIVLKPGRGSVEPTFTEVTAIDPILSKYFGEESFLTELKRLFPPLFTETSVETLTQELALLAPLFSTTEKFKSFLLENPYLFAMQTQATLHALSSVLESNHEFSKLQQAELLPYLIPILMIETEMLKLGIVHQCISASEAIQKAQTWMARKSGGFGFNITEVAKKMGLAADKISADQALSYPEKILLND